MGAVQGADGWFNLRQYDRYHRVQLSVSGNDSSALGNPVGAEVTSLSYEMRVGGSR
jgi:hypothetical protein